VHTRHDDPRVGLILVGFSPADRLAALARHLQWPGIVLSDRQRSLYRRLGIGRAPWWRVYSPGTLAVYAHARRAGRRIVRPVEDSRQLGGDAVMVDAVVTTVWRPRSPDDRPSPTDVLDAATDAVAARR
jgi:hypothetical protein